MVRESSALSLHSGHNVLEASWSKASPQKRRFKRFELGAFGPLGLWAFGPGVAALPSVQAYAETLQTAASRASSKTARPAADEQREREGEGRERASQKACTRQWAAGLLQAPVKVNEESARCYDVGGGPGRASTLASDAVCLAASVISKRPEAAELPPLGPLPARRSPSSCR